jgi:GxxExxY protein
MPIVYKGIALGSAYRVDLLVEDVVIVELKSVDRLVPVHDAQVLTYLGLTGVRRLINTRAETPRRPLRPAGGRPHRRGDLRASVSLC